MRVLDINAAVLIPTIGRPGLAQLVATVDRDPAPSTVVADYRRKRDQGKTHLEALRCLKRRLSDVIYRHLVNDVAAASPGGHLGTTLTSSAAGSTPTTSSSDKSLPGLANHDSTTAQPAA